MLSVYTLLVSALNNIARIVSITQMCELCTCALYMFDTLISLNFWVLIAGIW